MHFVDRCIKLDLRKAFRKSAGIRSEQFRKISLLKIVDPIRHAEMTKVDNQHNVPPSKFAENQIRKRPIEFGKIIRLIYEEFFRAARIG